jgi:hypothetical protein
MVRGSMGRGAAVEDRGVLRIGRSWIAVKEARGVLKLGRGCEARLDGRSLAPADGVLDPWLLGGKSQRSVSG